MATLLLLSPVFRVNALMEGRSLISFTVYWIFRGYAATNERTPNERQLRILFTRPRFTGHGKLDSYPSPVDLAARASSRLRLLSRARASTRVRSNINFYCPRCGGIARRSDIEPSLSSKRGRKYARGCYLNLKPSAARPSRALSPRIYSRPPRR
jgi:hypothetical protein